MKSLFLFGTVVLSALPQAPFPFDRGDINQIERLTAPAQITVMSLDQEQHDLLASAWIIEN